METYEYIYDPNNGIKKKTKSKEGRIIVNNYNTLQGGAISLIAAGSIGVLIIVGGLVSYKLFFSSSIKSPTNRQDQSDLLFISKVANNSNSSKENIIKAMSKCRKLYIYYTNIIEKLKKNRFKKNKQNAKKKEQLQKESRHFTQRNTTITDLFNKLKNIKQQRITKTTKKWYDDEYMLFYGKIKDSIINQQYYSSEHWIEEAKKNDILYNRELEKTREKNNRDQRSRRLQKKFYIQQLIKFDRTDDNKIYYENKSIRQLKNDYEYRNELKRDQFGTNYPGRRRQFRSSDDEEDDDTEFQKIKSEIESLFKKAERKSVTIFGTTREHVRYNTTTFDTRAIKVEMIETRKKIIRSWIEKIINSEELANASTITEKELMYITFFRELHWPSDSTVRDGDNGTMENGYLLFQGAKREWKTFIKDDTRSSPIKKIINEFQKLGLSISNYITNSASNKNKLTQFIHNLSVTQQLHTGGTQVVSEGLEEPLFDNELKTLLITNTNRQIDQFIKEIDSKIEMIADNLFKNKFINRKTAITTQELLSILKPILEDY